MASGRRAFHPSLVASGRTVLIEDVAVPRSALPAMFEAIQRIEKAIFLPSYETSGSDTSPLPCVMAAVTLISRALAEDFSRMIRSPPGALGVPSVGFMFSVTARLA